MKAQITMKGTLIPWILLIGFLGLILFLNTTFSWCSDDCTYALANNLANGITPTPRLSNIVEVWQENFADGYRPVVHFFVRLFTGVLGKPAFSIANTMIMALFILLLYRSAKGTCQLRFEHLILTIVLVFFILCKGESYLWGAGSVNYLWTATASLGFYLLRERIENGKKIGRFCFFAVTFAFFCGWMQEAFSLPLCFAIGIYSLFHLRELNKEKLFFYGAYGLGTLALVINAAGRASTIGEFGVIEFCVTQIKILAAMKGVWVLIILLFFLKDRREFIRKNAFELLAVLGSYLMISVVGFNGERCLWAANLFSILLIIRTIIPRLGIAFFMLAMLVVTAFAVVSLGAQIKTNFLTFTSMYLNSPSGITCHERVNCGYFSRFFHQVVFSWQDDGGHGRSYAAYHGRTQAPMALSRELYDNLYLNDKICTAENRLPIKGDFYTTKTANAIIFPIPSQDGIEKWKTVNVNVKVDFPSGIIARSKREIALRRNPPVSNLSKTRCLICNHGAYLLIPKLPECDEYIREIAIHNQ